MVLLGIKKVFIKIINICYQNSWMVFTNSDIGSTFWNIKAADSVQGMKTIRCSIIQYEIFLQKNKLLHIKISHFFWPFWESLWQQNFTTTHSFLVLSWWQASIFLHSIEQPTFTTIFSLFFYIFFANTTRHTN